jgi:hypothetical protein
MEMQLPNQLLNQLFHHQAMELHRDQLLQLHTI